MYFEGRIGRFLTCILTCILMVFSEILRCFTLTEEKKKNPETRMNRGISRFLVARPEGFEPPAFRIGICCDIQLRHGRITHIL